MRAYHGDPDLKSSFVKVLQWHRDHDKILNGAYRFHFYNDDQVEIEGFKPFVSFGKGCAVGCSIESIRIIRGDPIPDDTGNFTQFHAQHSLYEKYIGVPKILAMLEDVLFERMSASKARDWPIFFARAIPVGADLSMVWPKIALTILTDFNFGLGLANWSWSEESNLIKELLIQKYTNILIGNPETVMDINTRDSLRSLDRLGMMLDTRYTVYHDVSGMIDALTRLVSNADQSDRTYYQTREALSDFYSDMMLSIINMCPVVKDPSDINQRW